jgi:hypothetical protein
MIYTYISLAQDKQGNFRWGCVTNQALTYPSRHQSPSVDSVQAPSHRMLLFRHRTVRQTVHNLQETAPRFRVDVKVVKRELGLHEKAVGFGYTLFDLDCNF